ncbi:Di-copper centre-containing protein [Poronia punctata]|nr:Di-copper centre-containing protein [Poronia punctata]
MPFEVRKCSLQCLHLAIALWILHVGAQTGPVPVTGRSTGFDQATGNPPPRWNINGLEKDGGPMWDLFIRGLDALQNAAENDERSHFAIAGIHGMPYVPYNNVGPVAGSGWRGYCPHLSPQLISWHRAYLALYEQVLGDQVGRLASEYTGGNAAAYREASQKFRLPFWDWAADARLPPSTERENITVNGPDGELVLHNPLYNYRWQTDPRNSTLFPGQRDMGLATTRGGAPNLVDSNLIGAANLIKDSVYRTFASSTTYDQMASMSASGSSFEAPHNEIHNLVGGSFTSLDLAAFDPLFMLHHSNLDRLAALWTCIHNDTLQTSPYTSLGLYATAKGESITATSSLKPFYQADGRTFHNGETVSEIEALGYTYPELSMMGHNQGRREAVIAQIQKLYGDPADVGNAADAPKPRLQWLVDVRVDRVHLPLPCSIDVYLGGCLAGRTTLLSMPKTGLVYDELSLSRAVRNLGINDSQAGTVEWTLVNGLRVGVSKRPAGGQDDGTLVDPRDIPGLTIELASEVLLPPSWESSFPPYRNRTILSTVSARAETGYSRYC